MQPFFVCRSFNSSYLKDLVAVRGDVKIKY